MKIGAIPESMTELLLTGIGAIPTPLIDTFQAMVRARTIMVAVKLGVFEALKDQPATAEEVAARIGANAHATEKLLGSRRLGVSALACPSLHAGSGRASGCYGQPAIAARQHAASVSGMGSRREIRGFRPHGKALTRA